MLNRKKLLYCAAFASVAIIAGVCGHLAASHSASPTVHAATNNGIVPYTTILRETVIDGNGAAHPGGIATMAVRSDGSNVFRLGEASSERRILFADGKRVTVDSGQKMKSTTQVHAELVIASILDPAANCTDSIRKSPLPAGKAMDKGTFVAEEVVDGYRTAKVKRGNDLAWHALDHGCAVIRSEMNFGKQGKSVKRLVALTPGEPDPALFAVDPNYAEMPPSRLLPVDPKCTGTCAENLAAMRRRLDDNYLRNKHSAH